MGWQAKTILASALFIVFALGGCEAPKEIGLPPEVIAEVLFTDTLTVRTSTVLLDSVRTSNAQQLLAGAYRDPIFGKVSAQPFFEIGSLLNLNLSSDGTTNTNTYVYDSLTLDVQYTYWYGDTLKPFELNIHRLSDTLITNKTYYNNSTISYDKTPIASVKFMPTPFSKNTFKFKLPNSLGKQIFDLSGKPEASTTAKFVQAIKGFTMVPAANNDMVLGFSPTSGMILNLYIHKSTADTVALVKTFTNQKRFNRVQSDKQGTALAQIQPLKPLSASQTGGLNYVQDALGIVTKIEFPYLSKLVTDGRIAINRAELSIIPNQPTSSVYNLPSGLIMAETDASNQLLRTKGGTELLLPVDGTTFQNYVLPQVAGYSLKRLHYDFILTTYLQATTIGYKKSTGLLLMPASFASALAQLQQPYSSYYPFLNSRLERFTINPTRQNVKLQLFYTTSK